MDEIATAQSENENLRRIRSRLMQWEAKTEALAALNVQQEEYIEVLTNAWHTDCDDVEIESLRKIEKQKTGHDKDLTPSALNVEKPVTSASFRELLALPAPGIATSSDFLLWFNRVHEEIQENDDSVYHKYLAQLKLRSSECDSILEEIAAALERLQALKEEYEFVSQKTSALNTASEQLIGEQDKLQELSDEIHRRLQYFNQVDVLYQRLQSPTLSVASESFRECLNRIDMCLAYLRENPKFKDSAAFTVKYKHCLAKAITLMKSYSTMVMAQATEATLNPKQALMSVADSNITSPDTAFALYYGKYQTSAAKIKRISQLVESRINQSPEYEHLLSEMQQNYLTEREAIISPAVDKAIKDLKTSHKGDHCSLMRSTCAFLVHVCQDEQRLYYQFFSLSSDLLTVYLDGMCTILYDTLRPFIIHINHLETLAEICSILRIEMLEEHVNQNPEALQAFASIANQLLQDVQERLVFRAHLYLQSDILNYNPSSGDLAYPDKLEMMESIALSIQEPHHLHRSDSRSSLVSNVSSAVETESVETAYRVRNINSPADLHGMWYPTVRRTLVCLSRLYRCVDRPIFQGLSQEALKLCIQSVNSAANKISTLKSPIDGELFEIKHLLILREQIAPFRVDFTVKETSLDFSKMKTAAFGLLHKRKQLFSMGSNNALLEFLLEGTPQIREHLLDSRKEVDRQLKTVCEKFIKDAVQMIIGPLITFLDKAETLLANNTEHKNREVNESKTPPKVSYVLRQTTWASPQQISSVIQETQRLIKSKLSSLQRSMQLYLSNRDTEFIIFRPIRNNIIQNFVKLEQLLTTNGYTGDDMIITGCPTAEQVSVLLSSASILATEIIANFSAVQRRMSTSSTVDGSSTTQMPPSSTGTTITRKLSTEKKVSFESGPQMENLPELPESSSSNSVPSSPAIASPSPLPIEPSNSQQPEDEEIINDPVAK